MTTPTPRYKLDQDMCRQIQSLADASGVPNYAGLMPDDSLVVTDSLAKISGAVQTWTFPPSKRRSAGKGFGCAE